MPENGVIQKAKVNGIRMAYRVAGQGPPLVMIMGLGANMDWWDPRLIEGLAPTFRMVLFDSRGAGRSDASPEAYSIRRFADDTAALMDALEIPRAHVLGISMGGMIAQELALNHPEKVERLVLCSTFCGGPHAVLAKREVLAVVAGASAASSRDEGARSVASICFSKPYMDEHPDQIESFIHDALIAPTSPETFVRQSQAVAAFNSFDRLAGIRAPTLVLHGRQDVLIPPENGPILAQAIPGARLVLLDKCAHGLAEEVEDVVRQVSEFLLETSRPAAPTHRV